jgi:hypothetical protein
LKIIHNLNRKYNYYAYVIGKALPVKVKPYYLSYHAFFSEIIRSRYITREQSVCRMRINFWEETLKECLGAQDKKINEPMMIVLKEAIKNSGIRKETLFRLIDFQLFDIERSGELNTMEELEIFAENTNSLLLYLNLNLFGINEREAYVAASHLGRGIGIVSVLKRMPALIKMHTCQMPIQLLDKHSVAMSNVWDREGRVKEEFFDCVLE